MNRYIDSEKLKAEIERFSATEYGDNTFGDDVANGALDYVLEEIIPSLQQEQPEVNFKIEERKWVHDAVDNVFPEDGDFMSEVDFRKILKDTARHFAEWGAIHLNTRKEE